MSVFFGWGIAAGRLTPSATFGKEEEGNVADAAKLPECVCIRQGQYGRKADETVAKPVLIHEIKAPSVKIHDSSNFYMD